MKKVWLGLLLFLAVTANAQSYKGIWQGYITASDSYLSGYSLNVLEQDGNIITGKAYLYHNTLYYAKGKFDFIGTVKGNICKITELKIVDSLVKKDSASLCLKLMSLELLSQNNFEFLVGNWDGQTYKSDCIPGKVYLRRFTAIDPEGIEPIPEKLLATMKLDKPPMMFLKTELAKPIVLNVASNVITLSVSDYLRADHDTVSVYFNRNEVVSKLHLLKRPRNYTIRMEKLSGLNEIIMYADNLGYVPPNTSTLTIDDGTRKQKVIISSTLQKSAVIYLRYEPSKPK